MGKFNEAFSLSSDKKDTPGLPPPSFAEATDTAPPQQASFGGPSSGFGQGTTVPTYACLLLAGRDKLRTVNFPEYANTPIQDAIKRVWAAGIQNQGYKSPGNYEWKLSGNPCTF
jgi:hypothetical protein